MAHTLPKFNGHGGVEQWLKQALSKLETLQIPINERNNLIPEMLPGEALIL